MIAIDLTLRPTAVGQQPRAFLIPSDDPRVWVDLLVESGCPLSAGAMRLFLLPTSRKDPRPSGLLAVPPAGHAVHVPPRALGYAAVADRLFHPVDSLPYPPATPAELAAALTWDINILHPGLGLVGLPAEAALTLADLLAPPPRRSARWDRAVPGPPPPQPLTAVWVEQPPDLRAMLDQGRDDIATEAPQSLPRDPGDPMIKPLFKAGMMAPIALASAALESLRQLLGRNAPPGGAAASTKANQGASAPGAGGEPGWLQRFLATFTGNKSLSGQGAGGLANMISRHLEELRRRELNRLLDLLAKSPDEGLRYAIPMAFNGAPRGLSAPGGSLAPRDLNFTLNALRGGGPIDPWDIPGDVQARLRADYRRLANRELALGRHRRAAYIFAQLLGDISAAASALQQGRFYRDAAALYRERLHQPLQAATCLEEGGLLTEAIDLYNTLGMHEKVGDLYTRLEQPDRATIAYRTQVESLRSTKGFLAAAALLETKLRAPDEALALLDGAWPDAADAIACLEESFAMRGRLARHPDATARLAAVAKAATPDRLVTPLVQVFARFATGYPDADLRVRAADAARVLAGNTLRTALPEQAAALVTAVTSLDADDRLLARDGQRFLKSAQPRPRPKRPASPAWKPRLVREFTVANPLTRYSAAFPLSTEFVLLGHTLLDVTVTFSNWVGSSRVVRLPQFFEERPKDPFFVAAPYFSRSKLAALFLHEARTRIHTFTAAAGQTDRILPPLGGQEAGALLGMCADNATQTLWTLRQQNDIVLSAWDMAAGTLRSTKTMDDLLPMAPFNMGPDSELRLLDAPHVPMIARNDHLFFALRDRVVNLAYLQRATTFAFDSPIRSITAADPLSRTRVAVVAEEECRLITADGRDLRFGEGMYRPLTTFTRGGILVACDGHELRFYRTENDRLTRGSACQRDRERPLALLPTNVTNQFAAVDAAGSVQVFEIEE